MTKVAKLKLYATYRGMVAPTIVGALDLPRHIQHADVMVVAETKLAATGLIAATAGVYGGYSPNELRVAMGTTADAYQAAGLVDRPRVLVTGDVGHPCDHRVLDVQADGTTTMLGHLAHGWNGNLPARTFTPASRP